VLFWKNKKHNSRVSDDCNTLLIVTCPQLARYVRIGMKVAFKTPAIASLSLFVVAATQSLVQPCWLLLFSFQFVFFHFVLEQALRDTEFFGSPCLNVVSLFQSLPNKFFLNAVKDFREA